jgi:hypothetical protein
VQLFHLPSLFILSILITFEDLITNLPYITNYTAQSMTYWVDGFPCAVVFECMVSTGYIPSGLKTLIISSAWDGIVYAYGTSGASCKSLSFPDLFLCDLWLAVDIGKTFEDISEFVAGYVAFAGSVVRPSSSLHPITFLFRWNLLSTCITINTSPIQLSSLLAAFIISISCHSILSTVLLRSQIRM